jgi:hypothetical protein
LAQRTESAARKFNSVAVEVGSNRSDLRRHVAPVPGQVSAGRVCEWLDAGFGTLAGREESEVLSGDLRVRLSTGSGPVRGPGASARNEGCSSVGHRRDTTAARALGERFGARRCDRAGTTA